MENQRGNIKCCRFIEFSSNFDNVIPHAFVFVRCQDYLDIERFPTILKQQQQHWKIDISCVDCRRIEQAMKRGKIKGSAMDSRTMMRGESGDDFDIVKP